MTLLHLQNPTMRHLDSVGSNDLSMFRTTITNTVRDSTLGWVDAKASRKATNYWVLVTRLDARFHFNHELLKKKKRFSAKYIQVITSFQISEFMTGPSLLAHSNLVTKNQLRSSKETGTETPKQQNDAKDCWRYRNHYSSKIEFSWNTWNILWNRPVLRVTVISDA